ncbi:hypothetical protein [Flavonifractor phage Chenonceau]|nr:hypothetical protein [Flavonifractor phage Chenonceau]
MRWCFIRRSSPHEAGGGTRAQVLTEFLGERQVSKAEKLTTYPARGIYTAPQLQETGEAPMRGNAWRDIPPPPLKQKIRARPTGRKGRCHLTPLP